MRSYSLAFLAACTFLAANLPAQDLLRAPDGGTSHHVDGVELLALPGKPLTGKSSIEWTHTLADGSTVAVSGLANLARDSQGRMYRERREWVPAGSGQENPLIEMQYFDPVEKTKTVCTVRLKQCVVSDYRLRIRLIAVPAAASVHDGRTIVTEKLGSKTIEGIEVSGTRETTTIAPGEIGNTRQFVSTRDFWYSAELETNLTVVRNDPRDGKQVIRLVDLSRSEPDPQQFLLPAGFAVIDSRAAAASER